MPFCPHSPSKASRCAPKSCWLPACGCSQSALGCQVSAGIAESKLVAKLGSACKDLTPVEHMSFRPLIIVVAERSQTQPPDHRSQLRHGLPVSDAPVWMSTAKPHLYFAGVLSFMASVKIKDLHRAWRGQCRQASRMDPLCYGSVPTCSAFPSLIMQALAEQAVASKQPLHLRLTRLRKVRCQLRRAFASLLSKCTCHGWGRRQQAG